MIREYKKSGKIQYALFGRIDTIISYNSTNYLISNIEKILEVKDNKIYYLSTNGHLRVSLKN